MFSDNAVLNDTPQLMPHNYCTCSLIQIWHTTNYNFSKYLIKKKNTYMDFKICPLLQSALTT